MSAKTTCYLYWRVDKHATFKKAYEAQVKEILEPSWQGKTHYATGSSRINSDHAATLHADSGFTDLEFSETLKIDDYSLEVMASE